MNTKKTTASIIVIVMVMITVFTGVASAKSAYLIADHHTAQFDVWNVHPNGTVSYQTSYNMIYASDPSGIAVDESSKTLFVTTAGSSLNVTFEFVDATTMTSLGYVSVGPGDFFAGIAVDDANDIVYTVYRGTDDLYAFDWDPTGPSVTLKAGYPIDLPNCAGAMGIALDETTGTFWVADYSSGVARAYDTTTWTEDTSKSYHPSAGVMDIAVDRQRGFVYTTSYSGGTSLSKYDLATSTETTVALTCNSVGVDVDELTGYVYVTVSPYCAHLGQLQVWDTSTTPWTQVDVDDVSGSPAGICIPCGFGVVFNPLNLTNEHGLTDCVKPGESITYTICYDNMKNPEVHNVTIVDDLPAEANFASATDGGVYDSATHTVTWDIGTIPANTSQQCVQLVVRVDNAATPGINITNSATISGDEPGYTGPTTVNAEVCVVKGSSCCASVPVGPTPPGYSNVPILTPVGMLVLIGILVFIGAGVIRKRR